ncbi:MAG TPA: AbrB/MazE/SpoVT family DNA-binding domain-containing protein [Terriglobales bacterium]|nr:AbrB/MazE/SpoVT family DNA-binding domain-containing protein [Terriglobales bacterium]
MEAAQAQMVRWGNSLAVRIPKNVADEAQLSEGDKLVLQSEAPGNVVIKAIERPTLNQLLERITDENLHKEVNWGKPVGNEAW